MRAAWFVARTRLRERRRSWIVLVLVSTLVIASVMALAAGGRRADTVYGRFLSEQNADDVGVTSGGGGTAFAALDLQEVAALPQVARAASMDVFFTLGRTGDGTLIPPRVAAVMVANDDIWGGGLNRVKILKGRPANPRDPHEMVANFTYEQDYGLHVGSTATMRFVTPERLPSLFAAINDAVPETLDVGPLVTFEIVGVGVVPGQLPPINSSGLPPLWTTPAFARTYGIHLAAAPALAVQLHRRDADVDAFKSEVEGLAGGKPVLFFTQRDSTEAVQRSFHTQAVSLYLLAALIAFVGGLFVAQSLGREAWTESGEPGLPALGMSRRQRAEAFVFQGLLAAVAACLLGAVLAYCVSPLMPLGLARLADPSPGAELDVAVFACVLAAALSFILTLSALQGWRAERDQSPTVRIKTKPAILERLSATPIPISALTGVRLAFQGARGRNAVPVRTTLGGIWLGLLTATAAVVFGASLAHLVATPRLWGATWQARLGDGFALDVGGVVARGLREDPWVHGLAEGAAAQLTLDERVRVDALALDETKGEVELPLVIEGRPPRKPDEIFLGTAVVRELGKRVGDDVVVSLGGSSKRLTLVGRGPLPLGAFRDAGRSGLVTFSMLEQLTPAVGANIFIVDGPPGTSPKEAIGYLAAHHPGVGVFGHEVPTDVANFGRVEELPLVVGALLAALALVTLIHALVVAIRASRRDVAVLKALGFVRRQVAGAVTCQAVALVATAAALGIPVGISIGRWLWRLFADRLGTLALPVVPAGRIGAIAAGAGLAALLAAARPAFAASRLSAASVLRAE